MCLSIYIYIIFLKISYSSIQRGCSQISKNFTTIIIIIIKIKTANKQQQFDKRTSRI